jgi:hypothetical protein
MMMMMMSDGWKFLWSIVYGEALSCGGVWCKWEAFGVWCG